MLKEKRVIPVEVRLYCDNCGREMEYGGVALTTYPMQYPHHCPSCGHTETQSKIYPAFGYKEDDSVTNTREFDDVLRSKDE